MDEARKRRIAKTAMVALILGAVACDAPAKSAADAKKDGGAAPEGIDRSGSTDKEHCGGDEKH